MADFLEDETKSAESEDDIWLSCSLMLANDAGFERGSCT